MQLLRREPTFDGASPINRHTKRSLLPFLGDALSWLMGTATTKDVSSIKNRGQSANCNTTQTTRKSSTYYLCFKCHQICHSGEQTTCQPSDGCSRKDTSGCHHTLQHHQFTIQQLKLPADCTAHLLHSGKPQRFTILNETSHQACNGLHRCSHSWYTTTACTPSRSPEMLIHMEEVTTSNHALTSFIRGDTSLL